MSGEPRPIDRRVLRLLAEGGLWTATDVAARLPCSLTHADRTLGRLRALGLAARAGVYGSFRRRHAITDLGRACNVKPAQIAKTRRK